MKVHTNVLRFLALSAVLLCTPSGMRAQDAGIPRARPTIAVFVGSGLFATPLDVTDNSRDLRVPLLGVAVEVPASPRLSVTFSTAAGALPGGTQGGSVSSGLMLDAAAQWLVTSLEHQWGVYMGPAVTHTRFGVGRTGMGGIVSAGVRRGIGPRLTVRTHAMSGDELGLATRVELGFVLTR